MKITPRQDSYQVTGTQAGKRVRKQFRTIEEAELYVSSLSASLNVVTKGSFRHLYELACQTRDTWRMVSSKPRANAKLVLDSSDLWDRHIDSVGLDELNTTFKRFENLGNSGSTVNRKKSSLSVLYALGRELEHTTKTFSFLKQSGKAENGRTRVFTSNEIQSMYQACEDLGFDLLSDMIVVLVNGGLRVGELYTVFNNPKLLNKKTQRLKVLTSKGGEDRTILLNSKVFASLTSIIKRDEIYRQRVFNSRWDTMRSYMGLDYDVQCVPHALRHTCASKLVSAGIQLVKIKEYMGHKNIQTTMKYVHIDEAALDECAAALDF
jgi:site-specific recombinase XerD